MRTKTPFELLLLALSLTVLSGCGSRNMTKPHSEVMQEARSRGIEMPDPAAERELFFSADSAHQKRLLSLLRKRSQGDSRDATYRVGPGDEIEVNVFDVPEMNVTVRVNQSGHVSLPLVGAVPAGGMTESDLREKLRQRLSSYVKNPQVSVFISQYASQKVSILGAVGTPGNYPLKKGSNSVLELLSEAGGISDKAGNFVNFIPSELSGISSSNDLESRARLALGMDNASKGRSTTIEIALDRILGTSGGIPLEIPVRGGDMIVVPESGKVMVEGEIEKAGSYELGNRASLLGALAAAGGITYGAKVDEVEVIREIGGGKGRLIIDLERIAMGDEKDPPLRAGDIVRVPSDSSRRLRQDTFDGITKIINFGVGGSVNLGP